MVVKGLSSELYTAVGNQLADCFAEGFAPTRKRIMDGLKAKHPELIEPRTELIVANLLNEFVNDRLLKRVGGKFYYPGPNMEKVKNAQDQIQRIPAIN